MGSGGILQVIQVSDDVEFRCNAVSVNIDDLTHKNIQLSTNYLFSFHALENNGGYAIDKHHPMTRC
jgi:hypothetical protein